MPAVAPLPPDGIDGAPAVWTVSAGWSPLQAVIVAIVNPMAVTVNVRRMRSLGEGAAWVRRQIAVPVLLKFR